MRRLIRRFLRTLFVIQSPSALFLGTAKPTPRWVRVFWAIYGIPGRILDWLLVH